MYAVGHCTAYLLSFINHQTHYFIYTLNLAAAFLNKINLIRKIKATVLNEFRHELRATVTTCTNVLDYRHVDYGGDTWTTLLACIAKVQYET